MKGGLHQRRFGLGVALPLVACGCVGGSGPGEATRQTQGAATVPGLTGAPFNLVAKAGHISTPDGNSLLVWGLADAATGHVQYPAPTLKVKVDDVVTVNLQNDLDEPVSLIFPGQDIDQTPVLTPGGAVQSLAAEAAPNGGTVSYTFTASRPGTYYYQSGTNMDIQVEMGLFGALIVYPNTVGQAYDDSTADSAFDREYLFLLSEMDPRIHDGIENGWAFDTTDYFPVLWFINGRTAPDTMSESFVDWLPAQPYGAMARMHPGDRVLMRLIGMGRDGHPFHPHGNHAQVIAQDGRLSESTPGTGADLSSLAFTMTVTPGTTIDAIYTWTGEDLGWDVYGPNHAALPPGYESHYTDPRYSHGVAAPAPLPTLADVEPGDFWSGTPYLGTKGPLPPGFGLLNEAGGYYHMWHSHNEKELTTFDVFPGGLMTMVAIEHPSVPIDQGMMP